jgi:hypothetical protein
MTQVPLSRKGKAIDRTPVLFTSVRSNKAKTGWPQRAVRTKNVTCAADAGLVEGKVNMNS